MRARIVWIIVGVAAAIAGGAMLWQGQRGATTASGAPAAATALPTAPTARFVGAAACAGCHATEHAAWKGSDHDLAMQVADDKSVLGDFAGAKFAYAGTTTTFFRRDGRFMVNTDGPDGKLRDYEVKYAFGVRPLQQYLIEFPGGRMQALSIAWDSRPKAQGGQRWFHLYPGQNIRAGDPLHWTGIGQNWNFMCAECHSTQLAKNFDAATDAFRTTWAELNVACEACHGPGSDHVGWAKKEGDWQSHAAGRGLAIALDERRGVVWVPVAATGNAVRSVPRRTAREIETCARCHSRASRISDDFVHGRPPLDTHRPALLDDNLFWNDGQMRDEVYNWGPFTQSRMHASGVTCSDCHEPHSLQLRAAGNAVCAQCHLPAKYDVPAHAHHASGTPAAACTACHMPTTTYMVVDPRHDHSMRIPRPDVSARLGMPNACNNCHRKQTAQWAADAILEWTGRAPKSFQNFADSLRDGTAGAPGARGKLLGLIDDKAQPAIVRASALARLGPWLTPVTVDPVIRATNDADPLVRMAAVEALAHAEPATRLRVLPRLLDDPVRMVRIETARALAGAPEQGLPATRRAAFDRALAEYMTAQAYNADRPEGRAALGTLYAERGDSAAAIVEYRKALALDPTYVQAYANLADVQRGQRAEQDAEATLREGLARNPKSPVLRYALGLSLARQKRTPESLKELGDATKLAPGDARLAYVYAVALNDAGKRKEALDLLRTALKRSPWDRDVLTGLVHFSLQAGDRAEALRYANLLRELDPENQEHAQLVQRVAATPAR